MKNAKWLLTLLLAAFFTTASCAQAVSGNQLMEGLSQKDTATIRYLVGVVDGVTATRNYAEVNPEGLPNQVATDARRAIGKFWGCQPAKATYGQIVDIVLAYLKSRPAIRHLDASVIMAFAMRDAWPCADNE